MATFIENIITPGQGLVSTQNGRIIIDEAQAELVFTQPDGTRKVVHNAQGSSYKDENGVELTLIDDEGVTVGTPAERRARLGYHPDGTRINVWVSPEGTDVIELLESEA